MTMRSLGCLRYRATMLCIERQAFMRTKLGKALITSPMVSNGTDPSSTNPNS